MAVILVTDAEQRAALATVRSLGRAGHHVHVTALSPSPLAAASRFCQSVTCVPDPMRDPRANAAAHTTIAHRLGAQVLLPIAEATALAVLETPPDGVAVPMPDLETFRRVCDKARVLADADKIGIRIPRQLVLSDRRNAQQLLEDEGALLPMPAIVKPSRSIAGPGGEQLKLPVRYVQSLADVRAILNDTPDAAFPLLLQERIRGDGLGVFLLMWNGEEVASFGHRRLREKPPTGGVSTLREAVTPSPELLRRSRELLGALGVTHGVAMVEFKAGSHTDPVLMEINGRLWGSLQLAIDAGVDFPAMLVELALGQRVSPVRTYERGVSSRWFWGDVDHVIARVRRHLDVRGEPCAESAWTVCRDVLFTARAGQREEVWQSDDRRPFLRETWHWFLRR